MGMGIDTDVTYLQCNNYSVRLINLKDKDLSYTQLANCSGIKY